MTTRELFKKRVIELIHGLPYEEAVKLELKHVYRTMCKDCGNEAFFDNETNFHIYLCGTCESDVDVNEICRYSPHPITISRVMQAMSNSKDILYTVGNKGVCRVTGLNNKHVYDPVFNWQLTTEDGATATDDNQTDEAIEKLYKLIK